MMEYKTVGTKWYKCDLHLHTNVSKCFKDETYTHELFIDTAMEKGLECIAITDHNTGENVDKIKKAAEGKNITLFPGVEITCSDAKIHILILFNPDKTTQDIEDFLLQKMSLSRDKFGEVDAHVNKTVFDVLKIVSESGAIAIPAHIDEYNGLSLVAEEMKKGIFQDKLVPSVQIVHEELLKTNLSKAEKDKISVTLNEYYGKTDIDADKVKEWNSCAKYLEKLAKLTFSDNPNAEKSSKHGLWGIGKSYSWIKMGETPCLESLRQAFLVPDLRVKNIFQSIETPYESPAFWINGISVHNTSITDSKKEFNLKFNPQLNALIGGRGSGKSSILRFIRGVFGKEKDLDDLPTIKREFVDFYKEADRNKIGVLNTDSEITIYATKNGIQYQINASSIRNINTQNISISKFDIETSTYIPVEQEEYLTLFDLRIFSQKQIFEIASYPNALINIVDSAIEGLSEIQNAVSESKAEYLALASEIRSLEEKVSGKMKLESEISEIEERIRLLKKSGITDLLSKKQQYSKEQSYIEQYLKTFDDAVTSINSAVNIMEQISFDSTQLLSEEKDSVVTIINALNKVKLITVKNINANITSINNAIKKSKTDIEGSLWNIAKDKNDTAITTKKEELGEKAVQNVDTFQKLLEEKETKVAKLKLIKDNEIEITEKAKRLKNKYKQYLEKIAEVSKLRNGFLKNIIHSENVKISVKPYRDKTGFEKNFRNIIQKESEYPEPIDYLLEKCFSNKLPDNLNTIHSDLHELRKGNVPDGYDGYFKNCIQKLSPEQFDKLILLVPNDEISAEYKPPGSSKFKAISTASAGQKTATILTFLLSFGNEPLILDQPEDDLDNHLVYGLIVDRLKESKENRQVIVVTHNANIPVNGDSEYIITMDSESQYLNVLHQGSIDEDDIKKEICDVMEGGEDAFKLRSKRYEIKAT